MTHVADDIDPSTYLSRLNIQYIKKIIGVDIGGTRSRRRGGKAVSQSKDGELTIVYVYASYVVSGGKEKK